jgi:hypothetical protein
MNSDLLQWLCAIVLLCLGALAIVFLWTKTIDGLLWVFNRLQPFARSTKNSQF